MLKVSLINMPFAPLEYPVLGLTNLKSLMERKYQGRVAVDEALYLNLEFANYMGLETYQFMCKSADTQTAGYGDWFFRQSAFPDLPDNSEVYFRRYFPLLDDELKRIKQIIIERRETLD
ncbi:MAG TPA: hypothetical protein VD835_11355, partial [Pyrinomonadaceae bacterium]|nr:hypothetical protein [Pyrinomonadaceae bacterium]